MFNFAHIEHYHALRNTLYHQGNQVIAVPIKQLEGYAKLAVELLNEYLEIDLSENLNTPEPEIKTSDDSVVDYAEVEVSFGRFRIERLKSQSIRVLSLVLLCHFVVYCWHAWQMGMFQPGQSGKFALLVPSQGTVQTPLLAI